MMIRTLAVLLGLLCVCAPAQAQDFSRESAAASELHAMCARDHARLWGADLCGPLLVADPSTRIAWASQADGENKLTRQGDGWTGALPQGVGIANTSMEWAGVRWIMVMGPLPADASERRVLVAHEAWHRVQQSIGLPQAPSDCVHLETERGRTLMRLEMRALAVAMRANGAARWNATRDALAFRAQRLAAFPEAQTQETALDRNEGLASYTGVKLGAGRAPFSYAAQTLDTFDHHQALARAYAYATGPAYGLLLDQRGQTWRRHLGADAPADLLARALGAAAQSVSTYGADQIAAEEGARAEAQRLRVAELRARFSVGPRLVLPLTQMRMEFDPNHVTPVDGMGNVYQSLTIHDAWGELRATEGAAIFSDYQHATAAGPDESGLAGPGWTVQLHPGYRVTAPDAAGVRTILGAPPSP